MEVSALKYHGGLGLQSRSPLLRLQSDERLVAFVRRGNVAAFETLVGRYESRLLAFCRHLLSSREDAEDILQEVLAAAFNAILADDRPIKVRPWLYRIARNRSLNHLRRNQAVGVDSMDVHFSDNGASTADKVHDREEFRLLVGDIQDLPETQRTALILREMDALSYEQIAEAMETTVPSVKSLLVRARVSLAEAAEARLLSCDQVRLELGEVAEGLRRRPGPLVRRHLRACERCSTFRLQLRETNKALTALLPLGPFVVLKKLVFTHLGHSAGSSAAGSGAGTAGSTAAGGTAFGGSALVASSGAGGSLMSAGIGAVATKAAAGIAAAALVTAGAVEVDSSGRHAHHQAVAAVAPPLTEVTAPQLPVHPAVKHHPAASQSAKSAPKKTPPTSASNSQTKTTKVNKANVTGKTAASKTHALRAKATPPLGRTVTTTDATNLRSGACGSSPVAAGASDPAATGGTGASCSTTSTTPTTTTDPTTTTATTTTAPTTTTPDPSTTPTDTSTTDSGSTSAPSQQSGSSPTAPAQGSNPQGTTPQGYPFSVTP